MDRSRLDLLAWLAVFTIINMKCQRIYADNTTEKSGHKPKCVLNEMAKDAIRRAKTNSCKSLIKETLCEISSNPNYFPSSLPRYCPISNGDFGDLMGCVSKTSIDTSGFLPHNLNSSTMCIDYCLKCQAPFAAYDETTGNCSCWWRRLDIPSRATMDENRTCSDWINENRNSDVTDLVTIYKTGFALLPHPLSAPTNPSNTSIAFFLLTSGRKNLRQVKRLMRAIYSSEHYYIIHVDSSEVYLYRELSKLTARYPNVAMTKKRHRTSWASTNFLSAHLDTYRELLEDLKWNFSFVMTLSESDFPLKTVEMLSEFLSMFPNRNFISGNSINMSEIYRFSELNLLYIFCDNRLYRVGEAPLIQNIVYHAGSEWMTISREFIEYLLYSDDELIQGARLRFKYTSIPVESFYHTVIVNSRYCGMYERISLRAINWDRKRGCTCYNSDVSDLCACSPLSYRITDKLTFAQVAQQPIFFARKFDPTIDERIIDWLDEKVFHLNLTDSAFYLQNMYHVDDSPARLADVNEILAAIESFSRTWLKQSQQYRDAANIRLEQVHSVFDLSTFLGYNFQYAVNGDEYIEVFMKLNAQTTILSKSIKQFDAGFTIDTRDNVVVDRVRTFIDPEVVTVVVEWTSEIDETWVLVIEDPTGNVLERALIAYSHEGSIIDIPIPVLTSPCMIGVWNARLLSASTNVTIASLDFLIFSANRSDANNVLWKVDAITFGKFWEPADICSTKKTSTTCVTEEISEVCTISRGFDDCARKRWSTFYHDVKTAW